MNRAKNSLTLLLLPILLCSVQSRGQDAPAKQDSPPAATQPAVADAAVGTETIVFMRHGEKPVDGRGQLTPQGLNRALALPDVLTKKFGKPDFIFAPDPHDKVRDKYGPSYYVRPLATIEPTAIKLDMPVQTPFGFTEIGKLNDELGKPQYANAMIFIAWEHLYEQKAAADLLKRFGGEVSQVPAWLGSDYDSLYIIKVHRAVGQIPTATFEHDHENLNGQSTAMPGPASK